MTSAQGQQPAPDIFSALGLPTEPLSAPPSNGVPVATAPGDARTGGTVPLDVAAADVSAAGRQAVRQDAGFDGLADLLEPGPKEPLVNLEDATQSPDLTSPSLGLAPSRSLGLPTVGPAAPRRPASVMPAPAQHQAAAALHRVPMPDFPPPVAASMGAAAMQAHPAASASPAFPPPVALAPVSDTPAQPSASSIAPFAGGASPSLPHELSEDTDKPRDAPWGWIALCVILAGGLVWVLYTQTDLFSGDVIETRKASKRAEAVAELKAQQAEQELEKKEYGTVRLDSEPKGARVWLVKDGPEAVFENLPVAHEYLVAVTAAGHIPRLRRVKGSELSSAVVLDLDALEPDALAAPPIPSADPPKLAQDIGTEIATLTLRSNTPAASLHLLVGYTPGAELANLDVSKTHRIKLTAPQFEPHDLVLKGRHWEDTGDGELSFEETVELRPAVARPEPESHDGDIVVEDDAKEDAQGVKPAEVEPEATAAPEPPKKKKRRRRSRRKRRHR